MNGTIYEIIDISPFKNSTQVRIYLPVEYLSKLSSSYGISSFKDYPLINSNFAQNFSDITMSLKMFNDKLENVLVTNMTYPIVFLFTKSNKDLGNCIFLNEAER